MINQQTTQTRTRTALITGASSGIGLACATELGARGWHVYGAQRSRPAHPVRGVTFLTLDVTDPLEVERVVTNVKSKTGRIDALINNAGFAVTGAIEDTSLEEARAQMETNFFGVFNMCHAIAPVMREQGAGHIITISSLAALIGIPFSGLYSASKAAVEALTESLRFELYR